MYLISDSLPYYSTVELLILFLFVIPIFFCIYLMKAHMYYLKYQRYRSYYN